MKAGAFLLSVVLSSVAFGQAVWPPLSSGATTRWYIVPLDNNWQPSNGMNYTVIIRNPDTAFSSALVDTSTVLDGSMKEYTTENGTENTFWSGPNAYLAASWGQFGALADAYGNALGSATADGASEFSAYIQPKFAFILDIDRLSTAAYRHMIHSTFPSRLSDRDLDPNGLHVDDIHQMTLRTYFLESMALSMQSTKGVSGVLAGLSYNPSGDVYGHSGSLDETRYATGGVQTGWVPDPPDYDQVPSWALGVRPFDVVLYRQPLHEGDTHYRYIGYLSIQTSAMTARSHSREVTTQLGGGGGGGMVSTTSLIGPAYQRMTDPTSSNSYAKERLRLFEMRVMRFNESVVRVTPALANNPNPGIDVSFAVKDSTGTVIYQADGVDETEISLPIDPGAGNYTLEISAPGYNTASYPFTIANEQVLDAGTITLYLSTN